MSDQRIERIKAAFPGRWAEIEDILYGSYESRLDVANARDNAAEARAASLRAALEGMLNCESWNGCPVHGWDARRALAEPEEGTTG